MPTDPEDRPTQAEAEDDMRDDRTQVEKLLDLNAWFTRNPDDFYSVYVGHPAHQSLRVPGIEVARALVSILNLTAPGDLDLIISCLLRAYGEKCVALEHYRPEFDDDGYEPDYSDETDQYDPF